MANTYIKAAFCIVMSRSDASIVRDAEAACDLIDRCPEDELAAAYEHLGTSFKQAFPAQGRNVFASFYEVFDDPVYPVLDCDISYGHPDAMGLQELTFTGEQFGVEQIARLLFACKSALPCAFQYSYDCDKLRIGEFGGGAVVITDHGISFHSTADMIQSAIDPATVQTATA